MLHIITCFEKTIEDKTVGLYRSLRKYGAHPEGFRIFGVSPRADFEPSAEAVREASRMGVEYVSLPLNEEFSYYPLMNKPLACRHIASHHPSDSYLFLDSDTLFLNETDLSIHHGTEVSIRPVDFQNVGATNMAEKNGSYWRAMYALAGVDTPRFVTPLLNDAPIFEYYNSGYVYTENPELFDRWLHLTTHLMRGAIRPDEGIFFVEQTALSACISAMKAEVTTLPQDINYPIHLHAPQSGEWCIKSIPQIRHVHYHRMYDPISQRREKIMHSGFGPKSEEVIDFLNWDNA